MWTAIAAVVASILGAVATTASVNKNNQTLIEEAQKNRDWQEQMSNTAYTRGVEDMKNAGLNPGMMYSGANMQASTPSGGAATGMQPMLKGMEVQNALNAALTKKQIQQVDADIDKTRAETDNILAETEQVRLITSWYPSLTEAQIAEIFSRVDLNASTEELNNAHRITRELENEWIPRLRSAEALNLDSQTSLNQINKYIRQWEKTYMDTYGVRPGDSAIADVTAFICKQLGISASDGIAKIKDFIERAFGSGTAPIITTDGLPSRGLGKTDKEKYRWLTHLKDSQLTDEWRQMRKDIFGY